MREEKLIENAAAMGRVLMSRLRGLHTDYPEIGDVRGLGLMIGTEFTSPKGDPWSDRAQAVTKAAMAEGLLLLTCGPWENTVRWIPPLIVNESHIQEALEKFTTALRVSR